MRKSKQAKPIWIRLVLIAVVFGVKTVSAQDTLQVAAASDLEPVLPLVLEQFQQTTGVHVEVTYDAPATLAVQVENGIPYDVFLSADQYYPQRLIVEGLASGNTPMVYGGANTPTIYAKGILVLWARKNSSLPAPSLDLLNNEDLKRLAIANPDNTIYGRAAVDALRKLKLYDQLAPKLLKAESIVMAAKHTDAGNADAGLISLTVALTPEMSAHGSYFEIPHRLYKPIEYGAVVLNRSGQANHAHGLINYLLSAPVQAKFAANGLASAR